MKKSVTELSEEELDVLFQELKKQILRARSKIQPVGDLPPERYNYLLFLQDRREGGPIQVNSNIPVTDMAEILVGTAGKIIHDLNHPKGEMASPLLPPSHLPRRN